MAVIPEPDWLSSYKAKRKPGFAPGVSGNPLGRKPGSKNRRSLVAAEFEREGSEIARVVIAKAKEGDMSACSLVLTRIEPPLRPRARTVEFELSADRPLAEQAQQVLVAVSQGRIDPETGQMLVNCISSFAAIRQVDDLQKRIERLESQR